MFRFTIRDVLWLMVVVGLTLSLLYYVSSYHKANNRWLYWQGAAHSLKDELEKEGITVTFHPTSSVEFPDKHVLIGRSDAPSE